MQGKKVVTIIPQKKKEAGSISGKEIKKRKVAGYARVSTDLEEQQNSYLSQLEYYRTYIKGRPDWEFAGMYSDEGISGTNTRKRDGFNRMVEDALLGKIDLIITKSVSRFARNTVDSLMTVRKLKEAGIEVYFEKENIYTLDQKGELLITIMSSLAQEESRSISENTTWGQRRRMAEGRGCLSFSRFLGYDRGPNGEFVINEEQAGIVRRIYGEYLDGKNASQIARGLMQDGVRTVTGKEKWHPATIRSILTNEKYRGDCLMQKYYVSDFLTKKSVKNYGELQQYYVSGHHEAIIPDQVFEEVQNRIASCRRTKSESGARDFSSFILCGDCGSYYGSKICHSTSKYKSIIYRCNHKYDGVRCETPSIPEERLKEMFVEAINRMISDRDKIMRRLSRIVDKNKEAERTAEFQKAADHAAQTENAYRNLIERMKKVPVSMEDYEERITAAADAYNQANRKCEAVRMKCRELEQIRYEACHISDMLKEMEDMVEEYNFRLMKRTVREIVVSRSGRAVFRFYGGIEIGVER